MDDFKNYYYFWTNYGFFYIITFLETLIPLLFFFGNDL